MNKKRWLSAALLAASLIPSTVMAQDGSSQNPAVGTFVVVCTSGVGGITSAAITMITLKEHNLRQESDLLESLTLMEDYLQHNEHDLRDAVALGAGPALNDVMVLFGRTAPLTAAERHGLRRQRQALVLALATPSTPERPVARARALYTILQPMLTATEGAR